jgi:hypothetical protein
MAVTRSSLTLALALALCAAAPLPAAAGQIASACSASARASSDARLCGCIQAVADRTLTQGDQRLAASFFKDPHRAQEVRMSDSANDESFWSRYVQFGQAAEQSCR